MIVLGKLGQGKSALVKTLLWRMLLFGRRAFVLDVKREYGSLCEAAGVRAISLRPGGGVRLNPLASRPEEHAQLELLRAVAATAIGDRVSQVEAAALREALHTVRLRGSGKPTLPEIVGLLFTPVAEMAQRLRTTPARLAGDVRRAALALQDLQGLEDEPKQKVLIELREGGAPPQYHRLRAHSARDVSELERDVATADERHPSRQ